MVSSSESTETHDDLLPGNTPCGRRLRILIIEDDPFTLTILQKRLQNDAYEVLTATNGTDGFRLIHTHRPDLVISDWMMPELDGLELCARIKREEFGRRIYFILLTARDKNEDKISALDKGADEYLVKPIDGQELMARLRAAERLIRLREELDRRNRELKNAHDRINKEIQAVSHIQRSLLPQQLPEAPGYEFAAHYQPSNECSGDFYDVIRLSCDHLGIVIGDVSGHGAPAMVAMALTRMLMHMYAVQLPDPATVLAHINQKMFDHLPTGQ